MEVYRQSQHELEILRLLACGENEIEAGKGYELDEVLAEAKDYGGTDVGDGM